MKKCKGHQYVAKSYMDDIAGIAFCQNCGKKEPIAEYVANRFAAQDRYEKAVNGALQEAHDRILTELATLLGGLKEK